MRLVDADNAPVMFDAEFKETKKLILEGETHLDNLAEGFAEAIHVIRAMQTIDAVPVTRCKDCKHAYIIAFFDNGSGTVLCGLLSSCQNVAQTVRQFDDFCSYGEQKASNKHDKA